MRARSMRLILLHTARREPGCSFALSWPARSSRAAAATTGARSPTSSSAARSRGARTSRAASRTSTRIPQNPSHLIGFEVDIMDALARRLGVKARMVQYNWSNLVPSLERGDFDIVMNGLEATAERARPDPAVGAVLRLRRDARGARGRAVSARSFDLDGKRVGTLNQTVRARHPAARSRRRAGALRGQRGAVPRPRAGPHRRACCSTTSSRIATAAPTSAHATACRTTSRAAPT